MNSRVYIAIDLKSFYASVECVERGLDPIKTNLVVADASRTEKTICLAVTPSLKAHGISGRARLFEVIQAVKEVNAQRQRKAPGRVFTGSSYNADEQRIARIVAGLYHRYPANVSLPRKERGYIPDLFEIHRPGGHSCILH